MSPKVPFKELQKEWYAILKQHGFKDIEIVKEGELFLRHTDSTYWYRKSRQMNESNAEYLAVIRSIVGDKDTHFRNDVHRYILDRYGEGISIKEIVNGLVARGTKRNRKSVRFIIRRYEMAWKLRTYTAKQLNVRTHDRH